ncbi:sensor histidine kinase [Spirosoma rhododendri]|uniref:histidine kinase n=1 Tax=Spirosoma rhododendri TaxID=2728024 RepID=A0A7L5DPG7_9BACT|nr:PAS domain-containing sensor histidine kinase [Spirosoma rhododendri]QJD79371.1 PAS domain-containing protein [Spirosoma rhododendri]
MNNAPNPINTQNQFSEFERFRTLARVTHDAGWDWELTTDRLWWTEGLKVQFGYDPDEWQSGSALWLERIHPDDRQRVSDSLALTMTGEKPNWASEYRFLKADGTYAYVHDRGHAVVQDGQVVRMVGAMQDVTSQVMILARQQQADQLKFVIDSALTAMALYAIVRDPITHEVVDLRYELINHMAERMTGRTADVLIGKTMRTAFPGIEQTGIWHRYKQLAQTGEAMRYHNHYVADGYDLWYEVQGVRNGDWIVLSFLDITELKNTQLKLETLNQDLIRTNENLQQFAYVASHDLQEPLRKIQSFGDLLKNSGLPTEGPATDYLTRMQDAARRMSVLIKDLLTYSRLTTQRDTFQPVSLDAVWQDTLTTLEMLIAETNAVVETDPLPVVQGDRVQLTQLLQNLVANALKFRQPGRPPHVQIRVQQLAAAALPESVHPVKAAAQYYRLDVTDNGIGFAQKDAGLIFNVFQRLHTRSQYEGTGIGLAIVDKVVRSHGGAITATSEPGSGTTFSVFLPADT